MLMYTHRAPAASHAAATCAAPSRLTRITSSGSVSARSTAVYAAACTTTSGSAARTARNTAGPSVTSKSASVHATTSSPAVRHSGTRVEPSRPSAPVTPTRTGG
ncbi:MAG: hypothetical protein A3I79_04600 [Gemmatimonadetes bacterium RIFCSPLOWO2_02_FULL_71_11]|nr:MAG: hypothetical protein A3I79_04600 [Gemmatimonadetes bacterium RIFCSPLOWO2_02_FULL_71_11]